MGAQFGQGMYQPQERFGGHTSTWPTSMGLNPELYDFKTFQRHEIFTIRLESCIARRKAAIAKASRIMREQE